MDAKTALSGVNASAGPFASSIANAARPRTRSTRPLSLASSGQYGLQYGWNAETYPWISQTGSDHQHPCHPDSHRRMCVQERPLKAAEHPSYDLHPPDYEYLNPLRWGGDRECCDRVARSALLRSPHGYGLVLATLPRRGINVCPNSCGRLHSLASPPPCPGVRVETFCAGSC